MSFRDNRDTMVERVAASLRRNHAAACRTYQRRANAANPGGPLIADVAAASIVDEALKVADDFRHYLSLVDRLIFDWQRPWFLENEARERGDQREAERQAMRRAA